MNRSYMSQMDRWLQKRGVAVGWGVALKKPKVAGSIPDGVIGNFY